MREGFKKFLDALAKGVSSIAQDIRHKVLEEGWFGKAVTPRAQNITVDAAGEQTLAERYGWSVRGERAERASELGWFGRDERAQGSLGPEHDRDAAAKEPKSPDRGIDL